LGETDNHLSGSFGSGRDRLGFSARFEFADLLSQAFGSRFSRGGVIVVQIFWLVWHFQTHAD
jgi:hypothetical protein